jgi:hypothetical protein
VLYVKSFLFKLPDFKNFVVAGLKRKQALLRSNLPGINPAADEVNPLKRGLDNCSKPFLINYF